MIDHLNSFLFFLYRVNMSASSSSDGSGEESMQITSNKDGSSNSSSLTIDNIPLEIVTKILQYIGPYRAVSVLKGVSREWKSIIESTPMIKYQPKPGYLHGLPKSTDHTDYLVDCSSTFEINTAVLSEKGMHLRSLKVLCPKKKNFKLDESKFMEAYKNWCCDFWQMIKIKCKNLLELHVTGSYEYFFEAMPSDLERPTFIRMNKCKVFLPCFTLKSTNLYFSECEVNLQYHPELSIMSSSLFFVNSSFKITPPENTLPEYCPNFNEYHFPRLTHLVLKNCFVSETKLGFFKICKYLWLMDLHEDQQTRFKSNDLRKRSPYEFLCYKPREGFMVSSLGVYLCRAKIKRLYLNNPSHGTGIDKTIVFGIASADYLLQYYTATGSRIIHHLMMTDRWYTDQDIAHLKIPFFIQLYDYSKRNLIESNADQGQIVKYAARAIDTGRTFVDPENFTSSVSKDRNLVNLVYTKSDPQKRVYVKSLIHNVLISVEEFILLHRDIFADYE